MAGITAELATIDRWNDVQRALTGGGDGRSCQCMWPVLPNAEWNATSAPERTELLRAEIADGPPPGVVCYVDGSAVGWARVGPRTAQRRLVRARLVKNGSAEPPDDPSVWALTCFSVRKEFRRQGVNAALLDAAIDYARASGARVLEAYPIDTGANPKTSSNSLYVGSLTTFLRAGFRVVARPTPARVVVALDLG